MFQAGKLRKDRQVALEAVGLKWSVLTSITWDSMFDTLKEYVEEKKQKFCCQIKILTVLAKMYDFKAVKVN